MSSVKESVAEVVARLGKKYAKAKQKLEESRTDNAELLEAAQKALTENERLLAYISKQDREISRLRDIVERRSESRAYTRGSGWDD